MKLRFLALAVLLFGTTLWAQLGVPAFPANPKANPSLTNTMFPYVDTAGNCPWVGAHSDLASGANFACAGTTAVFTRYNDSLFHIPSTQQTLTYYNSVLDFATNVGLTNINEQLFLHPTRNYYGNNAWKWSGIFDFFQNSSTGNGSVSQFNHGAFVLHSGVYTDVTCRLYGDGTCPPAVSLAAGDSLLIGLGEPFAIINFVLTSPASGATVTWQYSTGSGFSTATVTDGTSNLSVNGQVVLTPPPSGWHRQVASGSASKYWIEITSSAAVTFTSVTGDPWTTNTACPDCGAGHNANMRGWSHSAWAAGAALTVDGIPYNPTPPTSGPGGGATANFPYQGALNCYGGDPNRIFPNPSTTYSGGYIMAGQLAWKDTLTGVIPPLYNGVMQDNVAAITGCTATTPNINTLISSLDLPCAPSCTMSGIVSSYYLPAFAAAAAKIKAATPTGFVIGWNNSGSSQVGQTGGVYYNEFANRFTGSPHSTPFQWFDDAMLATNTGGSVGYAQFIDPTKFSNLQDPGFSTVWHAFDSDRGVMDGVGEFYLADAWCQSSRANCLASTSYDYNYSGYLWDTSANAAYNTTDEVAVYQTLSTLTSAVNATPLGTAVTFTVASDALYAPVGGPYYATFGQLRLCPASSCNDGDKIAVTRTGTNTFTTTNVSGGSVPPILKSYAIGATVQFATTQTLHTNPAYTWDNVGSWWALWQPVLGVDLGKPDYSGYNHGVRSCGSSCATTELPSPPAVFKTGAAITCIGHAGSNGCSASAPAACAHGTAHGDLWRRDFTKGVVLVRDYPYQGCTDDFDFASQNIDLTSLQSSCAPSCSYYQVHADGTTTGPVTALNIRAGEVFVGLPIASGTLDITTSSLPGGFLGVAYSQPVTATGGTPPYSWTVSSGSLCTGLSLSLTGTPSATVSGNPTHVQTCSFTVQVTDSLSATATQPLSITIVGYGPLVITTPPCPGGTIFVAYGGCTQTYTGGNGHNTWSVLSGSLPAGLAMSSSTGAITGTPTASGAFSFTTQATDTETPPQVATQPQTITVAGTGSLIIVTASLPNGTVGVPYSQTLTATGGTPPYTWSVLSGTFPASLGLSSGGTVSGTPSHVGSSPAPVTVKVTDSLAATNFQPYTLLINPARGATGSQGEISLGEILH